MADLKNRDTVIRGERMGVRRIAGYLPNWSIMQRALVYLVIMEVLAAGWIYYNLAGTGKLWTEGPELMLKYGTKSVLAIGFYILYKTARATKEKQLKP